MIFIAIIQKSKTILSVQVASGQHNVPIIISNFLALLQFKLTCIEYTLPREVIEKKKRKTIDDIHQWCN
jgi:hypothetical protein